MKKTITLLALVLCTQLFYAQTTVTKQNTLIKSNHNFGLTNPVFNEGSPMTYNPGQVDALGAAFSLDYTNQGGTSFDGYPSGTVGGYKAGGTYYPGNVAACGMPVQIQDLTHDLRINWKTSQAFANDIGDKWWATINVIFDSGTATSEPDPAVRDYDLVIQNVSYEQDDFSDLDNPGGRYWYFARETPDGPIKPFTVYIGDVPYQWAVRYKFFDYPPGDINEDKNDKVHIKFIPIDNANPIPYLDHSLKQFIDCTVEYLDFLPLSPEERTKADLKVAESSLWIKSISAGYEIYEGAAILNNDYFYTTVDNVAPNALTNLTVTEQSGTAVLNWDASTDTAFDTYTVYRSENGGAYIKIASNLRTNSYTDDSISNQNYNYYVTATDRSFNESSSSNVANLDLTPVISNQTITIDVVEDSYVRDGKFKNTNYGSANNLQIREINSNGDRRYAYLKFNLSGISNVVSATLRVNNTGNNGDVDVSTVSTDNWSENTIKWNGKPSPGSYINTYSFNNLGEFDLDVTNYIINELQGDGVASFILQGSTSNFMTIGSKEGGNGATLIIEYNNGSTQKGSKTKNSFVDSNVSKSITETKMYPNPTSSKLYFNIENADTDNGSIEIFDSIGRLVQKAHITGSKMDINLEVPTGIYLVRINNKEHSITKRVVKK
ncbi:T9SS type A sorting domain-containing protein [Siansivirga zeaxanthinifaciens]|uniref:Uncharacterized protein n=1 Tax=Siansivirga zeaxanthinifaciens CC-SAMT-1 TaxID=1454006 RepID=A0A0C5WIA2_9FLAO|nr:DNRLRE domain-containing protein [Siansivirga zeaxanthinifaciens]AJR04894.1 hypothetical protein AW14_08890 [Siansivirga zeaxanthinifaciens CC-SAMT-1]